jgi:hypothetical protein
VHEEEPVIWGDKEIAEHLRELEAAREQIAGLMGTIAEIRQRTIEECVAVVQELGEGQTELFADMLRLELAGKVG